MKKPDREQLKATPGYFLELMQRIGLSQSQVSDRVGIAKRRIQYLTLGERQTVLLGRKAYDPVVMSYPEQYTLEALAGLLDDPWATDAYAMLRQVETHLMHRQDEAAKTELLAAVHAVIAAKTPSNHGTKGAQ